jgi:23S rRNA (uridine2552-2'-O)-methyltransferase
MATYQHKDRYYRKAKERGLPSRASFKLEEILKKFKLVKLGATVMDLGAAPGGWTAILAKAVGARGKVLALDLEPLAKPAPAHVHFFQGDLESSHATKWIEVQLGKGKCAAIFSDMSPKLSGVAFRDRYRSFELGQLAFAIAERHLRAGGHLVMKQFPGEEFADF